MASAVLENQQAIKQLEGERPNDKQVHRRNAVGVVAEKGFPSLRWRPPALRHIFGDQGLTNVDSELEQFSMDAGSALQWKAVAGLVGILILVALLSSVIRF